MIAAFHEVRFPCGLTLGARGGPERRTQIVDLRSGREERNQLWAGSRRKWNAGYGLNTVDKLAQVVAFFEERAGRFYGFRWQDRFDMTSGPSPKIAVTPTDQTIGVGDGATKSFQLIKTYGAAYNPFARKILKPVAGTAVVALNGVAQASGWSVDATTGIVTFAAAPAAGAIVSAGYQFDVPVRFDLDYLEMEESAILAGIVPNIPVVELLG
ncbi:DUF2460 domain-containing protein [Methylocystis iwaonis]|uniref:Glycoside hydrolase family 24 n=1 Tax=Methylocystis iwaonis TaxID=2885079 RepID=A0ABM8E7S9_9HYPH|nr:DUF2460 domain-containing protein [Methylocystis iwaonis]BDV33916.1 glycoside hydrolase family 24 [Methylocystis iwaonis]